MTAKEYEIHLASDVVSNGVAAELSALGFVRDAFIGGTTGVVHPCHFTFDPHSRSQLDEVWNHSLTILGPRPTCEFYGYAEAEVTPPGCRIDLPWKDFDPSIPFPIGRLQYDVCPIDRHKDFDIHVTVDLATIHPQMQRKLEEEINFHFVDILKPAGNVVRVYTFQPLGLKVGRLVFDSLASYFQAAGGLRGKIKLEICTNFARFPSAANCVPPIVRELSFKAHKAPPQDCKAVTDPRGVVRLGW